MTCGIYLIRNVESGKCYVGQSRNIEARWKQHASCKDGFAIGRAIKKHGWNAFQASIIEECGADLLNDREQHWIMVLGSLSPGGYNLRTGGGQAAQFSDDVKARISIATKAALTPERVALSAAKRRGVPKSLEWCAAMSKRQQGEANVARLRELSANQTPETRAKISASHTGKVLSADTRAKISAAAKSEDRAQRLRSSPNYMSAETRAKMSSAAKARCERARLSKAPPP